MSVDPVTTGVQRVLAEQLAKQLWQSAKPADGDDPTNGAFDGLFASTLADAMTAKDKVK